MRAEYPARILAATALLAVAVVVARACLQSVTIDEADTYLVFASQDWPAHWHSASNNHLLNSLLMRLFTSIFGLSHATLRGPALLGAAAYIYAAYRLVRALPPTPAVQWALLVCLVYNPFVLDYLVAARGYSLALAFLLAAVAAAVVRGREGPAGTPPERTLALCSAFLALSFAANFSFAVVNGILLLVIWLWAAGERPERTPRGAAAGQLLAAALPGACITALLSLPTVAAFPRSQLVYGAGSLAETVSTVVEASLYEPNPYLAHPWLLPLLRSLAPYLFPATGIVLAAQIVLAGAPRRSKSGDTRWLSQLAFGLAGVLLLTLTVHWLAFRLTGLLLPKDRTAVYLAPLAALLAGTVAAIPPANTLMRLGGRLLRVALWVAAIYFLFCLRLTYFKEWKWDADVKKVYQVLGYYNHAHGVERVAVNWMYSAALNVYREQSGRETLAPLEGVQTYPRDRLVYVVYEPLDGAFLAEEGLAVVYRSAFSGVAVAVRPGLAQRDAASPAAGVMPTKHPGPPGCGSDAGTLAGDRADGRTP